MEPKIKAEGTVKLQETYVWAGAVRHYAILSLKFKTEIPVPSDDCFPFPTKPYEIHVQITKSQYDSLKKQIESSKAEEPVLRVKGDLELILSSICIN